MANKEMMRQLYERMVAEQQKYKAWLLEQPPNVILDNACKFTVREDIVMEMEVLELTDAQAAALLRSRTPLADVYRAWERAETHHMDDVRDVIEARADTVIRAEKEKGQQVPFLSLSDLLRGDIAHPTVPPAGPFPFQPV